jgi:hypothetical protein
VLLLVKAFHEEARDGSVVLDDEQSHGREPF